MSPFLDSNVVLYALGDADQKRDRALELLAGAPVTSTQVVNECSHVLGRKARWEPARVAEELTVLLQLVRFVEVSMS